MTGNVKNQGGGMFGFSKFIPIKNVNELIVSVDDPSGKDPKVPVYGFTTVEGKAPEYLGNGEPNKETYMGLDFNNEKGYQLRFKPTFSPKAKEEPKTLKVFNEEDKTVAENMDISKRGILMLKDSKKRYDEITATKTGGKKKRTKKRKSMKKKQRKTKRRKSLKKRKSIKKRKAQREGGIRPKGAITLDYSLFKSLPVSRFPTDF